MDKYLKLAARAWAKATLNIQKFAEAYVEAVTRFGDEAREKFAVAYPIFGEREWDRLCKIGNGELMPQFFLKSDSFVSKLLKMNSSIKWQRVLASAYPDGCIKVDRGKGPEKVRLSDLTKKEERALTMLMTDADEHLSPYELKAKFKALVVTVNKTSETGKTRKWSVCTVGGKKVVHINRSCNLDAGDIDFLRKRLSGARRIGVSGRMPADILSDLVNAVISLNSLRDDEWDFEEKHGQRDMWNDKVMAEHDSLLDDIQAARDYATRLVREATGNEKLEV